MSGSYNGFGVTVVGIIVGIVTAAASAAINLSKIGLQFNQEIEGYTTNFKFLLGSTELAAEKVEQLKEMASRTPFGIGDLSQATQTLLGFGIEAEKTDKILTMLGDAALGDKNKLQSLSLSFAQATSAGKLMGQDLMQMINAGFNPLNTIAQQTGLSVGQLKEIMSGTSEEAREVMLQTKGLTDYGRQIIEQNYISAENLYSALEAATSEGGLFYKGMEEASKTTNGLLSTMKDTANELLGKFLYPVSEFLRTNILPDTIDLLDALGGIAEGKEGSAGKAAEIGTNLLLNIINGIADGAANIAEPLITAIESVVTKIDASKLAGAGGKLIGKLVNAIATIIRGGGNIIAQLAPVLISAIPVFLEALLSSADFELAINAFIGSNATIFGRLLPTLVSALAQNIPQVVTILMEALAAAGPDIITGTTNIVWSLLSGLFQAVIQWMVFEMVPMAINTIMSALYGLGEVVFGFVKGLLIEIGKIPDTISNIFQGNQTVDEAIEGFKGLFAGVDNPVDKLDFAQDWVSSNKPTFSWESGFTVPTDRLKLSDYTPTTIGDVKVDVNVPSTNASPEDIGDAVAEAISIALGELINRKGAAHGTTPIMAR